MKKFFMLCSTLLLAFSLSSCSSKQEVTILDENGVEKEVIIENSDDPEVIYNALSYASNPKFDDVKSIYLKSKLKLDIRLNDDNDLGADLEAEAWADSDSNLHSKLFISEKGVLEGKKSNGKLSTELYSNNDENLYIDYDYELDSNKESKKIIINENTIGSLIEAILGSSIIPNLPELPDFSELPIPSIPGLTSLTAMDSSYMADFKEAYNEFKESFTSSKLEVKGVGSSSMTISLDLSLKDIFNYLNTNENAEITIPKGDATINLSYKLDTKSARPLEISLTIGGKDFNNILAELSKDVEDINKPEIALELKLEASYSDKSKVKLLSDKDKEEYKELTLPSFPF